MIAYGIEWRTFGLLYGALAGLVVLIFLLRIARRGRAVSSTLIWQKVMGSTRSLWKELLSLLVQLLLLLLVCLALVDPRPPEEAIARRWAVLVFDASESMAAYDGDAARLRLAGRQAWRLIETLAPVDRVMIVSAGAETEAHTPFTADREELKKALGNLAAGGVAPRFDEAAAYALSAFDYAGIGDDDERRLIVFTDRPDRLTLPETPGVETTVVGVGAAAPNLAITRFAVRRATAGAITYKAFIEVSNFSEYPARAELTLYTPEKILGKQTLALAPEEVFTRTVDLDFSAVGKLTVLLNDIVFAGGERGDAHRTDDAAFAFVPAMRKARVLLVHQDNRFLYNVLALNPEVDLVSLAPGEYQPAMAAGADVVVFDRFAPPQPPACSAVYFGVRGAPFVSSGVEDHPAPTGWADGPPLLRHVAMDSMLIEKAYILKPRQDDVVLMGHFEGALILLRVEENRFLLGVGFALEDTDFPLQMAFPIFMHNVIHIFANQPEGDIRSGYRLGERVELPVTAGRDRVVVKVPSGEKDKKITLPVRDGRAVFRPKAPGFYMYEDGEALKVFAVSLTDAEESNLAVTPGGALPAFEARPENVAADIWWPYFILAAMILAFLDMVLFFYGRLA